MWREKNNTLIQDFTFKDFNEAWSFMEQVAQLAKEMNHHPSWSNTYYKVSVQLTTHDEGNMITDTDKVLAKHIDEIYTQFNNNKNTT